MSKPQETMIVLFFLGILCFCHSHAAFPQTKEGDNPDAKQDYITQELQNSTVTSMVSLYLNKSQSTSM
uniref:Putative secreted protein n=1 Tax=Ixodes ricinus TaxID=34613 RepID=A0A6B0TZF0_IXORI